MNTLLNNIELDKNIEFYTILNDIISNETVKKMKNFRQHYDTSTYDHCFNVSYISYKICKKLKLDYKAAARGAMLHDLFLYDWRTNRNLSRLTRAHAFVHPKIALDNATTLFDLTEKEKDIIVKHMWPATLKFPKYPESFIITFVDKYSAIKEAFIFYNTYLTKKNFFRYAYVFLSLLILT